MSPRKESFEKGQSLVELGMSLTFLLIMATGIIDLGSMFFTSLSLRDTAQEGAIYGSYSPTDTTGILARIQDSASFPINAQNITDISVDCSGAACTQTSISSCQGQKITVHVGYNYEVLMPLIGAIIGSQNVPLHATVTSTILESEPTISYLKTLNQECP